jgi:hypothetical protein
MTTDNSLNIIYYVGDIDIEALSLVSLSKLPLRFNPNYTYNITLDDKQFILKFKWNTKYSFWTMEWYTQYEKLLCSVKLIPEKDIINNYRYKSELPQIILYTTANIGENKEEYPTQFDVEDGFNIVITNVTLEQ